MERLKNVSEELKVSESLSMIGLLNPREICSTPEFKGILMTKRSRMMSVFVW